MIIYKITNKVNNKVYVGQTTRTLEIRWKCHINESKHQHRPICRAIRKHGKENFYIEQLEYCSNKSELDEKEKYWIEKLNSMNPSFGYNARAGGNETTFSDRTRQKMSLAKKGKPSNKKDFSCSPETAAKISAANKGKRAWNKGRKLNQEEIRKHSEVRKGKTAWNKGIKFNNKPIVAINLETMEEFEFSSIHEVVSSLKIGRCAVQNVLSGRGKRTSNNYTYRYK